MNRSMTKVKNSELTAEGDLILGACGRQNASAGESGRRLDLPRADVPCSYGGEFTEVPNVH
jgi:hypothetical protein